MSERDPEMLKRARVEYSDVGAQDKEFRSHIEMMHDFAAAEVRRALVAEWEAR